jgi:hypothetical protein
MVGSSVGVDISSVAEATIVAVNVRVAAWTGVMVACSVGVTDGNNIKVVGGESA